MNMRPEEAAHALVDIERTERHSASAYRYRKASSHLILWGAIWILGYSTAYVWPRGWLIWLALVPIGIAGGFWLSRHQGAMTAGRVAFGWRYSATGLSAFLFIWAVLAIFPPRSGAQVAALIPLLVAICYVMLGLWRGGSRLALLGVAVGALTVGRYFWLPQYFLLWMAGVGGGALILGGFWLRKV
ncbi:MAG: hypothetical protein ACRD4R_04415 [Candidatus Acidiferrales bacterium]